MTAPTNLRELLELAAKAAGIDAHITDHGGRVRDQDGDYMDPWAPESDDGDSRRLQVACGIDLQIWPDRAAALWDRSAPGARPIHIERNEWHEDDAQAARWAVLRASAEMGRRMPATDPFGLRDDTGTMRCAQCIRPMSKGHPDICRGCKVTS